MPMLSPSKLLGRCNEIRRAGGAEELDQLLPGHPSQSNKCLIATNLNFECSINGVSEQATGAIISSRDIRLVEAAKALNLKTYRESVGEKFIYHLPKELRDSALAFDQGKYPPELSTDPYS